MPLAMQAKMLRVLEDCRVDRIGGSNPSPATSG
jgi:transcriptional regulator with PAS, ATPase and Fis domain